MPRVAIIAAASAVITTALTAAGFATITRLLAPAAGGWEACEEWTPADVDVNVTA